MENRVYAPDDAAITFYLQVYNDFPDAKSCLQHIRRHYPRSRVILISDGDDDPRYAKLARKTGADYRKGERLYPVENGGRMIQRILDVFLEKPSAYLLKIDTDTRIHRRFHYLPTGRIVFGTLEWETSGTRTRLDYPNVQGGFIGFTLDAARHMAESKLLLSDELLDYRRTYADNPDIIARAEHWRLISMDFVTRYACRRLAIGQVPFNEVYSVYRGRIDPGGQGYAATHPHKSARTT
jgi:hypothetical protein